MKCSAPTTAAAKPLAAYKHGVLPSHIGGPPPNPKLGPLLHKAGRRNPYPAIIGEGAKRVISGTSSLINLTEEGERK